MAACSCGSQCQKLIYACSGAANTGYLADAVARQMMNDGVGKMTCLAALGAQLSGFILSAGGAEKNIVIDGCSVACGKQIFEKLGLPFAHHVTTDLGVTKGKTEITAEVIARIAAEIEEAVT